MENKVEEKIATQSTVKPQFEENSKKYTGFIKRKIFLIPAIIILFSFFIFLSLFLDSKKNITLGNPPSTVSETLPTLTPTPAIKLQAYKNPAGFSIVYADTIGNWTCNSDGTKNYAASTSKIFDDGNTLFIAPATTAVYKQKTDNTGQLVPDTCKDTSVDINLLKNGWVSWVQNNGDNYMSYPTHVKYVYKHVDNDNDLISFAESTIGKDCTAIDKVPVNGQDSVFQIKPYNKNGKTGVGSGIACYMDYGFDFYYSTKYNVAIEGNARQNCPDSKVNVINGLGMGCETQITFP